MDAILCYKTQMQLVEAADTHIALPPECQAHLQECKECQAYAKTLALLVSTHIPAALDTETLRRAKATLAAKRRHHLWRRWALCAAAFAVVCGLAVFFTDFPEELPPGKSPAVVRTIFPPQDSTAEWDDLAFAADYVQVNDALTQMDLELDLFLAELD